MFNFHEIPRQLKCRSHFSKLIDEICNGEFIGMLSILIEKTERSDTTNLQSSIFNIQFQLVRVGLNLFKDLHNFYHISIAVLNQPIKIIRMIIKALSAFYT